MTEFTQQDKTLALVGTYQCAKMVLELATDGKTDEQALQTSLKSLFIESPNSTLEVYGNDVANIQKGVHTLLAQMSNEQAVQNRNMEITRYVLSMMVLAKALRNEPDKLNNISQTLATAKAQNEHFGEFHENMIATIARGYSENISSMTPRIMVNGHHQHLQNTRIANKIRAILLAGVRSALLWYQVGGSRWNLVWSRKKYLQSAQTLHRPSTTSVEDDHTTH